MNFQSLMDQELQVQAPHALEANLSHILAVLLARGLRRIATEGVLAPSQTQAEAAATGADARSVPTEATCLSA